MRSFNLSALAVIGVAIFSGAMLFWTSQNVQQAEGELRALQSAVVSEKDTIRVLRAEWGYLNRPDRLEALAVEHLGLMLLSAEDAVVPSGLLPGGIIQPDLFPEIYQPMLKPAVIQPAAGEMRIVPPRKPPYGAIPKEKSFNGLLESLRRKEGGE